MDSTYTRQNFINIFLFYRRKLSSRNYGVMSTDLLVLKSHLTIHCELRFFQSLTLVARFPNGLFFHFQLIF